MALHLKVKKHFADRHLHVKRLVHQLSNDQMGHGCHDQTLSRLNVCRQKGFLPKDVEVRLGSNFLPPQNTLAYFIRVLMTINVNSIVRSCN